MAVDLYAPCPCGSGKKLKFCCADLAADIEKIDKLAQSDQPRAALVHVEKLLAKEPDRASLLDMRAMLELALHEFDAAQKTLQHFLITHPDNASAHAQAAVMAAARGETLAAVGGLQNALERTDNMLPRRVFEAIGGVGHALLMAGDVVAARAHLLLYAGAAPEDDERAVELLLRLNLQGGLPLLLRDNLLLAAAPADASYKAPFDEARRMAQRGLWRRAEAEFAKLLDDAQPQPPIVYNLALVRGWLADTARFASGLHHFARLDVPLDEAVEAEALAQLVDPNLEESALESVRLTYPLANEEAATERLAADKRVEPYELDPETLEEDEVTRPRSTHILLDRAPPRSGAELTVDEAPNVLAFLSVYGKRTDRESRLEVTTDRGEHFQAVENLIAEILGDAISAVENTEVVGEKSAPDEALSWRWRLPDDTPPAHRRHLLSQRRRQAILDDWTAAPRAALGGLSPRDAAARPELRVPLLASVLIIEQAAVDPRERVLFQELREKLGLPAAETLDPDKVDWDRLPLVRVARLDFKRVPDDRLLQAFNRAGMSGAGVAALAAAEEIVTRPSLGDSLDAAYRLLIRSEPNPDRALAWAATAKERAQVAQKPAGQWALLELEVQIERGDPLGVQDALNDIRAHHINEPGVAEATYQLLYTAGLLVPRSVPGAGPAASPLEAPAAASQPGKLWTPSQDAPAAAGNKPAIWTP
jgi:tetratricopeptide (TPR) repeat protein